MSKRRGIHDVVRNGSDVQKIMEAIADGIDVTDIEESLRALGLKIRLDTVDFGGEFGTISIEGGENETGCILTLRLTKVEVGWDKLTIGDPVQQNGDQ